MLLGLLDVLLQLSPLDWCKQRTLSAVRQEVSQLRLQVIEDMLPLRWRLTTNLMGGTEGEERKDKDRTEGKEWRRRQPNRTE